MDSAGKRKCQMDPAHGPPLQARVAAANGTVLQLANMLIKLDDPGAHGNEQGQTKQMTLDKAHEANLNGAKQTERGQELVNGANKLLNGGKN